MFDEQRIAEDARVVDESIEAAERGMGVVNQLHDFRLDGHIRLNANDPS